MTSALDFRRHLGRAFIRSDDLHGRAGADHGTGYWYGISGQGLSVARRWLISLVGSLKREKSNQAVAFYRTGRKQPLFC